VHTAEYALLGFLLARALGRDRFAIAVVVGSLYGASDEYHQTFVPGRSGNDLGDWIADTIGTALGVLVYARLISARKDRPWL
jgi:VanZ family protein